MYSEQYDTMKQVKPVPGEINIFTTHGSIIDPILQMKLSAEQSPREIVIPDFLIQQQDWSYSFLGHIHERGWVSSKDGKTDTANSKIYYNGSLIRRGFSDKEVPLGRGWTLWSIDNDGKFSAEPRTVAQRPQYDFKEIDARKLTAEEITDKILENLRATQLNGNSFDTLTAPILRQTISGITPGKHSALDWKAISSNSEHAMHWNVKTTTLAIESDNNKESVSPQLKALSDNADMVKLYDDWADNAPSLKEAEDNLKEKVVKQAREFVKLGQEEVLDAD